MHTTIDGALYGTSQLFLVPVLLGIAVLFAYAFYALGACLVQAVQRHRGRGAGFELQQARATPPAWASVSLAVIRYMPLWRAVYSL